MSYCPATGVSPPQMCGGAWMMKLRISSCKMSGGSDAIETRFLVNDPLSAAASSFPSASSCGLPNNQLLTAAPTGMVAAAPGSLAAVRGGYGGGWSVADNGMQIL